MLHNLHFIGWKFNVLAAWWASFMTIAVTEAFLGQLILTLLASIIGAAPATVAIIMVAKKQTFERAEAQKLLLAGQAKMHADLDGKLDKLHKAETALAKAEGVVEGTKDERVRVALEPEKLTAPVPAAAPLPAEIKIVNKKTESVPTIPGTDRT